MNKSFGNFLLLFALAALPARAQDAAAVWNTLVEPTFNPARFAKVSNLSLTRDRIHLTLADGAIQFVQPVNSIVFGAAFEGNGHLQVTPPGPREQQQLRLFSNQDTLDTEFTQAAFLFTDGTFDEVARQVQWSDGPSGHIADILNGRLNDSAALPVEMQPRLFQGVLSTNRQRTAYFLADVKTRDKGWILLVMDALEPEEVSVGRWTDRENSKAFDTWLSFPAGDQSASEAYSNPIAKNDFTVPRYEIEAWVTGGAELTATTKALLQLRATGEHVLRFGLDSNLRVDSVKDGSGNSLQYFQARERKERLISYGDYLAVVLPQATQTGQALTLEFHYAGKHVVRRVGNGNYFCESEGWYPEIANTFATRSDFRLRFHMPKTYTLVTTGTKLDETTEASERVSDWSSDLPLSNAGFAFGDYKLVTDKVGPVDLEVYANRQPDDYLVSLGRGNFGPMNPSLMAKTMSTEVGNMLRIDEIYFGPYPYKRLAVTNIPYSYGQGWPMLLYLSALSFLDSTERHYLGVQDQTELTDFFRAHETSHQWWGQEVGWKSYHDQWLSEGFAQFSGNLYVQFRQNMREYLNRVRLDREHFLEKNRYSHVYETLGPVWMGARLSSSLAPNGYNVVVYDKGGYILHMLRMLLFDTRAQDPEQNFKAMMQDFTRTFANKAASTEDFKVIAEKHMSPWMDVDGNHRLDWFFNEYVYGIGVPEYKFQYSVQEAAGKWQVKGTVTQSGVPDGWKDILALYAHLPRRDVRLGWLGVKGKVTPFQFTLPVKPDKLVLNEEEDTLAVVKQ
jgi:Peptidase family M1 domain